MAALRILYVTSADFDATSAPTVRARGLARALARRGCGVTVVGANGDTAAEAREPYRFIRVPYPRARRAGHLTYQGTLAAKLAVSSGTFDLVLLRETPFSWQPYLSRLPVFLEVNGLAMEEAALHGARGVWVRLADRMYRWGYRRARAIFALTPRIRDYLVARMGAPADRIVVVSNAVEVDRLYPVDRAEARRALELAPGRWAFYVGSYHAQHGLAHLVDAAERLPSARFLMAGAGDGALREIVRARGLADRFRFLGRVSDDDLRRAIGAADLCLSPGAPEARSLTDASFPQKLLEYMACGRAVLSVGDSPQIRDAIEGAGEAIPLSAGHGASLAEAIGRMLARPDLDELGARGAARVRERFGYDRVVDQYLGAFQDRR